MLVAATNRPDHIDAALLRPGRFDRRLYVPPPNAEERLAILRLVCREAPLSPDVNLSELALGLEGCVRSRDDVLHVLGHHTGLSSTQIRGACLLQALGYLVLLSQCIEHATVHRYSAVRQKRRKLEVARQYSQSCLAWKP